MSYFIRSFSVSVNLRCSILRSSMSHPTNKVQNSDKLTLFAFFLFVFQLRVFTFYICFSILSSFFGPFAQILWLLRLRPSLLFLRGLLCLLRILGVSGQFCPWGPWLPNALLRGVNSIGTGWFGRLWGHIPGGSHLFLRANLLLLHFKFFF